MQSTITGKLSRRDFLRASAGLTGVVFLAACAPGAVPGAAPAGSEGAAPITGPVTITFAGWGETA